MWQSGHVSAPEHLRSRGTSTMTVEDVREQAEDVEYARAGVRHARVSYGPRSSRRPPKRTLTDTLRDFVTKYGWRAYALPVLLIVTVAALMTTTGATTEKDPTTKAPPVSQKHAPPVAGGQIDLKDDAPGANVDDSVLKAAELPSGQPYAKAGDGTFRVLKGNSAVVGTGPLFRYSIEVERGVNDVDVADFEHSVVSVLSDKRSWAGHGDSLQRVDSGHIDFHVTLTSAMTVRTLCGYTVPVETSCYVRAGTNGSDVDRVVLNDARWVRGASAYVGDLAAYRIYMINHEDGHALGHQHAHQCLPGGLAPVMMQQTFGLRSATNDELCQANPWPYPPGVKGVPGAEQQDTAANDEYGLGD